MNNAALDQAYRDIQADKKLSNDIRKAEPFNAIVAVAKTRNTKHANTILTSLGRIINENAISNDQFKGILESLQALATTTPEIQLRVLQILPAILSGNCPMLTSSNLVEYLTIPVSLVEMPNMVGSIASATLQQIMVSLFEKPSESREADVIRIFEDLCATYRGQQTGTISFSIMNKNAILELFESLFASDKSLFDKHPSLLDVDLLPIIMETLRDNRTSFPTVIRVMRISLQLVPVRSVLLQALLEVLPKAELWKQALILETLEGCSDSLHDTAASQIVNSLSFFEDVLPGLGSYETCAAPRSTDEQVTSEGVVYSETSGRADDEGLGDWSCAPRRLTSLLNANQAPMIRTQYVSFLVFQILNALSPSALQAWQGSLLMFSAFLSSSLSPQLEQTLLDSYLKVAVSLDTAGEPRPRDAFIRRIGRIAVSTSMVSLTRHAGTVEQTDSGSKAPSHRTFACLNTFISIVEAVRQTLDGNAWRQIIEILHASDVLFSHQRQRRQSHSGSLLTGIMQEERKPARLPQFAAEMSRVSSRVDLLWENTKDLPAESFTALITCLCSPQVETPGSPIADRSNGRATRTLHESFDSSATSQQSVHSSEDNHGFVLKTMKMVVEWNMFRFIAEQPHEAWILVVQFLRSEIQNGNIVAAETLGHFIKDAVQQSLPSEDQQLRFLHAVDLLNGDDAMHAIQIQSLAVVLESIGHDLVCGWDIILSILHESIGLYSAINSDTIRVGFSCLQMICTDLIGRLTEAQLPELIETVIAYSAQTASMNIALGATALLWNILDRLPADTDFAVLYSEFPIETEPGKLAQGDHLWMCFMKHVQLIAIDSRSEIRHSVLQICRRILSSSSSLGLNAFLTSVHLMLEFLFTIPDQLSKIDPGTVETTSNIISTARQVLQIADKVVDDNKCHEIWNHVSRFLLHTMSSDNVAVVSAAVDECHELLQISAQIGRPVNARIWECQWLMVVSGGRQMLHKEYSTPTISQECLAKYLSLLRMLCEVNLPEMNDELLTEVLSLVCETVQYTRCQYYLLDIDHLSTVQKSAVELLRSFLQQYPNHRSCLFKVIGSMLQLAAMADVRAEEYTRVTSSSSLWTGRPTFVALTAELLQIINAEYSLKEDPSLISMVALIEGSNSLIYSHTARESIAKKGQLYELWKTATDQIIDFVTLLEPQLSGQDSLPVWPHLLITVDCAMRPHSRASEEFVLSRLNTLCPRLVLSLDSQPHAYRIKYIETLYRSSWFHTQSELTETSTIIPEHYDDQIIREWCFLELLKMPLIYDNISLDNDSQVSTASVEHENCSLASCALPYVVRRAKNILARYKNNAALRANAPLSQLERNEMFLLLDHLGDETIDHANQRELIRQVYSLIVNSLTISQNNQQLFTKLRDVLLRVGGLI